MWVVVKLIRGELTENMTGPFDNEDDASSWIAEACDQAERDGTPDNVDYLAVALSSPNVVQ